MSAPLHSICTLPSAPLLCCCSSTPLLQSTGSALLRSAPSATACSALTASRLQPRHLAARHLRAALRAVLGLPRRRGRQAPALLAGRERVADCRLRSRRLLVQRRARLLLAGRLLLRVGSAARQGAGGQHVRGAGAVRQPRALEQGRQRRLPRVAGGRRLFLRRYARRHQAQRQ